MQNSIEKYNVKYVRYINDTLFELCTDRKNMDFEPGDCVAIHTSQGNQDHIVLHLVRVKIY